MRLDNIAAYSSNRAAIQQERNVNSETEELPENEHENLNHNDNNEPKENNDSLDKKDNHEDNDQVPVRKSERIRKRLIDLNPEDIGDNDNAKDKDYKLY